MSHNLQMNRVEYFDYLRVFATFSVVILHISAQNWYTSDVNGFTWQVFNFFDSAVRWGVPVFLMISGSLFLDRDISIKKIFSKYVLRLFISFFVWSAIYAFFSDDSVTAKLSMMARGHYHMWFIPMLAGIYICIPFIKAMISSEKILKYYLTLAFVFAFLIPEITTLTQDFAHGLIVKCVNVIGQHANTMNMNIVLGYASYFVLGFYLNKTNLNIVQRIVIYIFGIIGFIATIYLSLIVSIKLQKPCGNYYDALRVNVLFESVAIFILFKYKKYKVKRRSIMMKLSKYCYGAYLVHALIIEQLYQRLGLNTLSFNPIFSVMCIGIIAFATSFLISAIINQIPVANNYIV